MAMSLRWYASITAVQNIDSICDVGEEASCYMAMPSRRPPQKSMRIGGRGPQTPPKTKQEKVTEINTKLTSKSGTKWDGTLKRTGKYNVSIF